LEDRFGAKKGVDQRYLGNERCHSCASAYKVVAHYLIFIFSARGIPMQALPEAGERDSSASTVFGHVRAFISAMVEGELNIARMRKNIAMLSARKL
jgi:hypothetical protein